MHNLHDLDGILEFVLRCCRGYAAADAGILYLAGEFGLLFSQIQNDSLLRGQAQILAQYRNQILAVDSRSIAGYTALSRRILVLADVYDLPQDLPCAFNASVDQSLGYRSRSMVSLPLLDSNGRLLAVLQLINARDRRQRVVPFSRRSQEQVATFARHAAAAIMRGMQLQDFIVRMARLCARHDPGETVNHVQRVGAMAAEIYHSLAQEQGMAADQILQRKGLLRVAAMLHDMGKFFVPGHILKKSDRLSPDELQAMELHTVNGARLFDGGVSEFDRLSREIALNHHQRWDGRGYPTSPGAGSSPSDGKRGLAGEEIPLMARIVAVADVYDVLGSRRRYKLPWATEDILAYLRQGAGHHFDSRVVEALLRIPDIIAAIGQRYADNAGDAVMPDWVGEPQTAALLDAQRLGCGNVEDIYRELRHLFCLMAPDSSTAFLDLAYCDLRRIFSGQFPGFLASDTAYHDLRHTMSVALALVRLLHGRQLLTGEAVDATVMELALLSAFFHDTGLICRHEEKGQAGSGARYMIGHEERSITVLRSYCHLHDRSHAVDDCAQIIRCTKLALDPRTLSFSAEAVRQAGYMLASADILAQMADRVYLEKLPALHRELHEAGISGYESCVDLYRRTTQFAVQVLEHRLPWYFQDVSRMLRSHFRVRWGVDRDLYGEAIERSLRYIEELNQRCNDDSCYRQYLRRWVE